MKKEIVSFVHCRECVRSGEKSQLEVGMTPHGVQVWCRRHNLHVVHWTAADLESLLAHPPGCEHCKGAS